MPGSTLKRLSLWVSGAICVPCLLLALGWASPAGGDDSEESPVSQEDQELFERIRQGAEDGDAEAQAYMGSIYSQGEGVPEDPAAALTWYTMAAEQGHAVAQYNVAGFHATGRGVRVDHVLASAWFRKAAQQGLPQAQMQLAANYYIGRGVPWDPTEAEIWFSRPAESLASDQKPEALRYRDLALKLVRLLEAANDGQGDAQLVLGELHTRGGSVPLDPVEAYKWLSLAATSEDESSRLNATQALTALAEEMKQDQIREARQRSAEWSRAHPSE